MSRTRTRRASTLVRVSPLAVLLALSAAPARSDVVMEESINLDGAAGFSMLAMQGKSTTSLTPDKSRIDSDMQFKSKLMNRFAGQSGASSQIIRLDQGRVYDVNTATASTRR